MGDEAWKATPSEGGHSSDESTTGGDTENSSVKAFASSDGVEDEMHPVAVVRRINMYKSSKSNKGAKPRIMEIFCPPRFSAMAHIFGLQPTIAFDLTVGWDTNDKQSAKFMSEQLIKMEPLMVFGSRRCAAFSALSTWNKNKPAYPAAYEGPEAPHSMVRGVPTSKAERKMVLPWTSSIGI